MPIYERDGKTIHFVHIPKTAGSATRSCLEAVGWKNVYHEQKGILEVSKGKFYHGHMPYSYWKDWAPAREALFEFMIVRNPVVRANSLMHMWLISEFTKSWHEASNGGNEFLNDKVAEFFFDLGMLTNREAKGAELLSAVLLCITMDRVFEHKFSRELLHSAKIYTQEQYDDIVIQSQRICVQNHTKKMLKENVNPDLSQITWLDLLGFYFDRNDVENAERSRVSPCPMYLYEGERTKVYRQESLLGMADDLFRLNAIPSREVPPPVNIAINKFKPQKECQWDDNPEVRDIFFDLYSKDFEKYGYDRTTPFPLMKQD